MTLQMACRMKVSANHQKKSEMASKRILALVLLVVGSILLFWHLRVPAYIPGKVDYLCWTWMR